MEYNTAIRIREEWGTKPCTHPRLERLYYAGAFLVSYVCTKCGNEFTIAQKMEMDKLKKKATDNQAKSPK
jgi:transposase-like protein